MTVGGGRRGEVVAAPAAMNLTGALQASAPFSFFLANRAVAATGWPEKSNGSAVADPLAGERLRPCASVPPSSGFAAVLEPAREHQVSSMNTITVTLAPDSTNELLHKRWGSPRPPHKDVVAAPHQIEGSMTLPASFTLQGAGAPSSCFGSLMNHSTKALSLANSLTKS